MPEITDEEYEELQKLRALIPQATPEEAEEIVEEAAEIIEEAANEPEPDPEVIEEATEIIEEATEIVEENNGSVQPDSESGSESDAEYYASPSDDASGGIDVEPIYAEPDGSDAVPTNSGHADNPPRSTHWWYRTLGRR
jgi:hypothetical protein